jgi:ABC-type dipeptide/oligopeptide/nickel transport system permease subunit
VRAPLRPRSSTTPTFDVEARSTWRRAARRFRRHRLATASLFFLALVFGIGLLSRHIAPYGYLEVNVNALSQAPSWAHPFGTDQIGRDYFSRILYTLGTEGKIALIIAFVGSFSARSRVSSPDTTAPSSARCSCG